MVIILSIGLYIICNKLRGNNDKNYFYIIHNNND